jgi:putative chitinase
MVVLWGRNKDYRGGGRMENFAGRPLLLGAWFLVLINTASAADAPTSTKCNGEESSSAIVSVEKLARFSPRASAELVTAIIRNWTLATQAGLATPLRVDHFLAQVATETGGLVRLDENLNYDADRLRKVFPRVTEEQAAALAHHPEETADFVYFKVNGNQDQGDGWTYRGSGFLQLTGRGNFAARGEKLGLPLVDQPYLVREPDAGFAAATAYWSSRAANSAADLDDLQKVRILVNGGLNGITDARIWLSRAKRIFPPPGVALAQEANAPSSEEIDAVKSKLEELGFLNRKADESYTASDFTEALKRFQASKSLPVTGIYDNRTLYCLTDPTYQNCLE